MKFVNESTQDIIINMY